VRRPATTHSIALCGTALVGLAVVLLSATGCGLFGGGRVAPVEVPTTPVGIVGQIKTIAHSDGSGVWGALLVEGGNQPEGAVSDKAMVTITDETLIARNTRWIPPEDLAVGMTVRVWFEGPVAESYPVQGSASFIEVQ